MMEERGADRGWSYLWTMYRGDRSGVLRLWIRDGKSKPSWGIRETLNHQEKKWKAKMKWRDDEWRNDRDRSLWPIALWHVHRWIHPFPSNLLSFFFLLQNKKIIMKWCYVLEQWMNSFSRLSVDGWMFRTKFYVQKARIGWMPDAPPPHRRTWTDSHELKIRKYKRSMDVSLQSFIHSFIHFVDSERRNNI